MTEVDKLLPKITNKKSDLILESLVLYLMEKYNRDNFERLRCGYCEMSQINLALAEMGLAEDMFDLDMYVERLGCEIA